MLDIRHTPILREKDLLLYAYGAEILSREVFVNSSIISGSWGIGFVPCL